MSAPAEHEHPLLRVQDLRVYLPVRGAGWTRRGGVIRAVDDVSLEIGCGRTLGLVGESGCGKSTLARAILRLVPVTAGSVRFDGQDVLALPARQLRPLRRQLQMVFQDAAGSLNPRMNVETIVGEALHVHRLVRGRRERRARVTALLARVGLPADALSRYPHEFSGGQRQRIGIARALALEPRLVICDEPVSALDVSLQSQILNLLAELQNALGLSYLFIAHNLAAVRHCSDEVAVMYLGRIVEQGPPAELFARPAHPYTQALLAAVPRLAAPPVAAASSLAAPERPSRSPRLPIRGEPPSPLDPPGGCPFHPRCPRAEPRCAVEKPELSPRPGLAPEHRAACHYAQG